MGTYSAGLRVSEVARLKVTDIDSDRMIRLDQGKSGKDRMTMLPQSLAGLACRQEGSVGRHERSGSRHEQSSSPHQAAGR